MGLSDITGVFSRYFVVGFFLPSYISLVALWLFASSEFVPNALDADHSRATQLLILGAVALIVAMALSGLNYDLTRLLEGYPLARTSSWLLVGRVYRSAIRAQERRFDELIAIRDDQSKPNAERARAAWRLHQYFPKERRDLLPTSVGNAIRAFEQHSNVRWGLDGVTIWPRVEALLSAEERELHVDAKVDFYVFMNAAVGAFVVAVCLAYDQAVYSPDYPGGWVLLTIPLIAAYLLYSFSLTPAVRWGDKVRASIDLHRLELYEKLGVRAPRSFSDELALADKVNRALLYGHPLLRDDLWREDHTKEVVKSAGLLERVRRWMRGGET